MTYEELRTELRNECYLAADVTLWLAFREAELKKLTFPECREIMESAALIMECDYNCC